MISGSKEMVHKTFAAHLVNLRERLMEVSTWRPVNLTAVTCNELLLELRFGTSGRCSLTFDKFGRPGFDHVFKRLTSIGTGGRLGDPEKARHVVEALLLMISPRRQWAYTWMQTEHRSRSED